MRWFEDLEIGEARELGRQAISEAEIIEFAQRYDPQSFHIDPVAAGSSIYGGLIASGMHSTAIGMRLVVDGWLGDIASLGSPGLDVLKLIEPVRPGDELHARVEVLDLRASRTRPDRGIVRYRMELLNQSDQVVVEAVAVVFVGRRPDR